MDESEQGKVKEKIKETGEALKETARHPWTKRLARFGFITKGVIFIVIGVLAALVAVGQQNGKLIGAQGALATIAQAPYGQILFWILAVGSAIYGIWSILRGVADIDDDGVGTLGIAKRIVAVGLGIFYLFLGFSALYIFLVSRKMTDAADNEVPRTITSIFLALPLGQIFVSLIGLGFMTAAVVLIYQGLSLEFLERLKTYKIKSGLKKVLVVTGISSSFARAVLMGLIGYFFLDAAFFYDPDKVVGLDGAMTTLAMQTYGKVLLFVTAFGIICHGLLSLFEAKFRRLD